MSINICQNFDYNAEINDYRTKLDWIRSLDFLVKALFRKNIGHVSDDLFHGKTVELDDITYYVNDGNPDFTYIIKVEELKYLMDSSFTIISDGYHQIIQLHDKSPQSYGYIAVKKSMKNNKENMYWGILNNHGKELIECKYSYIAPIVCKTVLYYDGDYIGGLSDRREDLLFFNCRKQQGLDVYANNGTLVFEDLLRINKTEEKIFYNYDNYEDDWIYTETKQLKKFHVGLLALHEEDVFDLYVRYIYQVNLDNKYAYLQYIGIDKKDQRELEYDKAYRAPEIPVPKVSRIKLGTVEDEFKLKETVLYAFLRKLTEDMTIYTYIEDCEVNFYFESFFFSEIHMFDAKQKKKELEYAEHEVILEKVSEAIENVLALRLKNTERKERKRQLEIEKSKWAEIKKAKLLNEKMKYQSQITLATKVTDCYFGFPDVVFEGEMTIDEFRAFDGETLLKNCNGKKELFEEIVTVLASHHIYFADCPSDCNIQSYFEKIYESYSPECKKEDVLSKSINELNFSIRTCNILNRAGIYTVENLIQHTESEIKQLRNIGFRGFEEILQKLDDLGVSLKQVGYSNNSKVYHNFGNPDWVEMCDNSKQIFDDSLSSFEDPDLDDFDVFEEE